MDTIGQTLKKARESKKRTVPEVAHAIRANSQYIEAIEAGNFRVFPAPIYALGFIRLYAECVGENFQPLEKAFRELEAEQAPEEQLPGKKKRASDARPGRKKPAPAPAKKVPEPAAPGKTGRSWFGVSSGLWPAALTKIRWLEFENRWTSLSAIRLPLETWKTILAVTGMTLLVIVAAAVLGWYLLSGNGATPATAATQWIAEPPVPYLNAE